MNLRDDFYLGRIYDTKTGKTIDQPLLYDPADLTTHAVVVGMTGSGKTGLCVDLMEEAALNQIPALMIDPKGDITNLLLHFPDMAPQDFQPWLNPDVVRGEGKTLEQAAAEVAQNWKDGLAGWGIKSDRIKALQDSVAFTIFTPGSDSGVPISILASLSVPSIPWEDNKELLREKISATVTALLNLVGLQNIDPVRSREHILLANIFENAWSQGKDLDLGELILQVQTPPFTKLGVFDVNTFFPEKDRFELAMLLNNILAAPAFQIWLEGQPLDIASLLYTPEGKPRHSIFYIAHLPDAERMFFVSLLFSAVETWMHTQTGTTSLRALVYFDEIFGYMPPVQNPPAKQPMLRMLKQARAFGVGLILVTQNPVDLDYKALTNAGTWFVGKLQTDQDKQRLLDGLEGASPGIDRQTYDRMISGLGKRVFLLHNVHAKQPVLFQTRFAMNYLAGPLTRAQIPALNKLASADLLKSTAGVAGASAEAQAQSSGLQPQEKAALKVRSAKGETEQGSLTKPTIPVGIAEYFLVNNLSLAEAEKNSGRSLPTGVQDIQLLYRPGLLAQANVRFLERKYDLDFEINQAALTTSADPRGRIRWEAISSSPVDPKALSEKPASSVRFVSPEAPLIDVKLMAALEKDFIEWVYRTSEVKVRANEFLKVYAGPNVPESEFSLHCQEAATRLRDQELEKLNDSYAKKNDSIQAKIDREQRELDQDKTELSHRQMEEFGTAAQTVFSIFGGRKRSISSSMTKRRMTSKASASVKESEETIKSYQKQIAELESEKAQAIQELDAEWALNAKKTTEIPLLPAKSDVLVSYFGVVWVPFYIVNTDGETVELPAYQLG